MDQDPFFVYIVGTAGSGKSHFTGAFQRWLKERGLDSTTINLDPGAEMLPYGPDIDIRDWIRLDDVMSRYGLGPNGAQVMAADLVALRLGEIQEILGEMRAPIVIVDTPGQTELFVFREAGRVTMDVLGPGRSAIIFLHDPYLAKKPNAFVSLQMLAATTQFRFGVPLLNVLTKMDLLKDEEFAQIMAWAKNSESLEDALMAETADMYTQMSTDALRALTGMGHGGQTFAVSSETLEGFEDPYSWLMEAFGASEDLSSD